MYTSLNIVSLVFLLVELYKYDRVVPLYGVSYVFSTDVFVWGWPSFSTEAHTIELFIIYLFINRN